MREQTITNAKIILTNEIIEGSVFIKDGLIADIQPETKSFSVTSSTLDAQGQYLLPGLVETHTDNMDKFFSPRPKVKWPMLSAVSSHDALLISSGITTVLDAISIGYEIDGGDRLENLDRMISALEESQKNQYTRAEHYLHLRCELGSEKTLSLFDKFKNHPLLHLVSLMDHAPLQRQFVSIKKYREYYQGKYGLNEQQMSDLEKMQLESSKKWAQPNRKEIAGFCQKQGIPTASHDDATEEHAQESHVLGCRIAEFPTTMHAAQKSHELGLSVVMGAPNVVRGGSHSGNIAAHELASAGILDILSSDYYPASLLDAVFILSNQEYGLPLQQCVNMVSSNPARALGMDDRGSIEIGKRADLLLVDYDQRHAKVNHVLVKGQRVY